MTNWIEQRWLAAEMPHILLYGIITAVLMTGIVLTAFGMADSMRASETRTEHGMGTTRSRINLTAGILLIMMSTIAACVAGKF